LLLLAAAIGATGARAADPGDPGELADLSLEQLSRVEITSVSRHSESLADAPASIYVISAEDIARAGATSLPEALRLAPNLEVAQVNASNYAVSARGFNNSLGNKLLVLIDGRTVYTPLFSGVFWDAQDLLLEDVERIEVISGPGATLWGANAVNGVINVITRSARDTQGWLLAASGGSDGDTAALRYGGKLASGAGWRVYARRRHVDATQGAGGVEWPDAWDSRQLGFRIDGGDDANGFSMHGDVYDAHSEERPFGPIRISGSNLVASWQGRRDDGAHWRVQAYVDRTERDDPVLFHDRMDVIDLDFQRGLTRGRHSLLWGGGARRAHDRVDGGVLTTFLPGERTLNRQNLFVQDEVALADTFSLTLGLKLDRNSFTGTEWLPSVRIAWKPGAQHLLWAAASRAVRAPSRIDREFFLPATPPFLIDGGPDFQSEIANVLEVGYRGQPGPRLSWSITGFHHWYDRLRSGEPQPAGNFQVQNGTAGRVWGVEAWGNVQATRRWRLSAGLVELRQRFWTKEGFHDPDGAVDLGNDPRHQWQLRSTLELSPTLEFDLQARGVGALPDPRIPSYTALDASLRWRPDARVEIALLLRNGLGDRHVEFAPGPLAGASELERSAALRLLLRW
jgi:iron complex outermembrane receptor protein